MTARKTIAIVLLFLICFAASISQAEVSHEVSFTVGSFHLEASLRLPDSSGQHPIVVFVHGDGPAYRTDYQRIAETFLRAGYGCLIWDKPGYGESTGGFTYGQMFHQRAEVVAGAVGFLKTLPSVDTTMIGLWGISQAGFVMPLALKMTERIAFMIAVSCPAMNSIDQMAYLISKQMICKGYSASEATTTGRYFAGRATAETYEEYLGFARGLDTNRYIRELGYSGIIGSEDFTPMDQSGEWYYNPINDIASVRIPILSIFGELDTQVDPFQGAVAFQIALERGRNRRFSVKIFPEANHGIMWSDTGCFGEMRSPLGDKPVGLVQEYLDTMERWLTALRP